MWNDDRPRGLPGPDADGAPSDEEGVEDEQDVEEIARSSSDGGEDGGEDGEEDDERGGGGPSPEMLAQVGGQRHTHTPATIAHQHSHDSSTHAPALTHLAVA